MDIIRALPNRSSQTEDQVWTVGQNVARNPLSSKRAMEVASNGGKPETRVVIALVGDR